MKTSEMRKVLREAGIPVKRANEEVLKDYEELQSRKALVDPAHVEVKPAKTFEKNDESPIVKLVSDNIFTYIGAGDEPPHMINFMGLQKFIRGQAIEVNNPFVIEKISSHRCFARGKVGMDQLFTNDEKEKNRADEQRKIDQQTQAKIDRVNKG